jgi:hypothetical protein
MVEIPENPITQAMLSTWYKMAQELKKLKTKEILLRKDIFGKAFPDPKEGTNNYGLDDGYVLKGQYQLTRDIDEGAFNALKEKLREEKINPDLLVQYKPSLVKKEYNKLTDEQKQLFDQCLIVKPGSPSLEIVLPAKAKAKQEETS